MSTKKGPFVLSVFSEYRQHELPDESPYVKLACTQNNGLAHCKSADTDNFKVDMYIQR